MYFTDDSLLPENQEPLMITAAPWGPAWLPSDYPEDIAVSWDDQIQKAVDCYNAGATILHIHCRDPQTGKVSKTLDHYGLFARAPAQGGAQDGTATWRFDFFRPGRRGREGKVARL